MTHTKKEKNQLILYQWCVKVIIAAQKDFGGHLLAVAAESHFVLLCTLSYQALIELLGAACPCTCSVSHLSSSQHIMQRGSVQSCNLHGVPPQVSQSVWKQSSSGFRWEYIQIINWCQEGFYTYRHVPAWMWTVYRERMLTDQQKQSIRAVLHI